MHSVLINQEITGTSARTNNTLLTHEHWSPWIKLIPQYLLHDLIFNFSTKANEYFDLFSIVFS
jgi:hypothetical protein